MRVKALLAVRCLVVALAALVQALAAITDTVDVKFDEWMTPSKPAYPHDPAVAPDGSIWYTGAAREHRSAASIRRRSSSRSSRCRRRTPGRTACSRTRTATSGTPATPPA